MREKINVKKLEEISLEEIPVLSGDNGESEKVECLWSMAEFEITINGYKMVIMVMVTIIEPLSDNHNLESQAKICHEDLKQGWADDISSR